MDINLQWDNVEERTGISKWNTTIYKWTDILLVLEVIAGNNVISGVDALPPEKKKQFIRLICKVKGIETYSGQKTIRDDIKVEAEDIELVIKEVLGIDLTVENIHV